MSEKKASNRGGKRPGAGRRQAGKPPLEQARVKGSVALPAELWAQLAQVAEKKGVSRNALIEAFLVAAVQD